MDRHLALAGFMGAGKSTVGSRVAARLGRRFVDLDRVVERDTGMSVADVFRDLGEPLFRDAEARALERELGAAEPSVIALGGGTVVDPGLRARARRRAWVLTLDVPLDEAVRRVSPEGGRPLLADDPGRVRALYEARRGAYADTDGVVPTAGVDADTVADRVVAWLAGDDV